MKEEYIIDVLDYRGVRVVFTRKKLQQKSIIHPDLLNKTFFKNVIETVKNPEIVWQDYNDKEHKRCYYKKYSNYSYVKVVIFVDGVFCRIVTAFQTNYIKESKYSELTRLK